MKINSKKIKQTSKKSKELRAQANKIFILTEECHRTLPLHCHSRSPSSVSAFTSFVIHIQTY